MSWRPRVPCMLLIALLFLPAPGCGHMPVTSMVKLAQVDFQTTDPEKLRVAVKLPQALKARADATVLRIAVKLANGAEEARDFALAETTATERAALAGEAEAGTELVAFSLAKNDIAQLRMFRAALMQRQKGGSGGSLTISVRPDACRTAPLPDGPVLFSTYLKTAETNGYVTLARDVDLRRLDPDQDLAAKVPACG
jgi:hypothetical protein